MFTLCKNRVYLYVELQPGCFRSFCRYLWATISKINSLNRIKASLECLQATWCHIWVNNADANKRGCFQDHFRLKKSLSLMKQMKYSAYSCIVFITSVKSYETSLPLSCPQECGSFISFYSTFYDNQSKWCQECGTNVNVGVTVLISEGNFASSVGHCAAERFLCGWQV